MDIVVKGRNVEVPEHYRTHVSAKLMRLERYDKKVFRYDVELFHEPNRRQSKSCQRVEITGKGKGPAVRAEACAGDFYAALDAAVSKLENRLRRMADRRRVHYGRRCPESVAEATSPTPVGAPASGSQPATSTAVLEAPAPVEAVELDAESLDLPMQRWDDMAEHQPGRVVREKHHPAEPMTVDQALYQMELVGHDFYLFNDADAGTPSVVYRRKGFDYGVIRLG
ncbi:ribosome-associated translation inhibitor RaiA [Amycolatopsis acidiphila]|uniref:Ribosome hibernation promoting factor n=1 Tax=Amycolatopsis acidiphila TaxID=715473 RepID=A0A558A1L8_9PSEU|nr:ribosome-associated translation inhibitor RaiA [Amycolatopsis acidiphila]TVT18153.1 ribosome-associated translation inhibitor RaiA [Amycolatopsis acidiphila]UIJ58894.1 ribosome-associated translation inhibitor RaiA [Amycolatopsis acidiphila]GHG72619.1 ribosomal subunit interface protein [Amycolatopsis acidiphila]